MNAPLERKKSSYQMPLIKLLIDPYFITMLVILLLSVSIYGWTIILTMWIIDKKKVISLEIFMRNFFKWMKYFDWSNVKEN